MKNGYESWIGVDFDGTLAYHEIGDMSLGEPIEDMVDFVLDLIDDDNVVKIMTARVGGNSEEENQEQERLIRAWCKQHLGFELEVTCKKDPGMIALYDDRAYHVVSNTGVIPLVHERD
jgi:hypothetical protein